MLNGCNLFEHGARNAPWYNEDLKWYEVWLIRFFVCVVYSYFLFFPKKKAGKKGSISSFDKVFPVRKLVLSVSTIVGMSSDFQISVVKGFLEFHRPPPLQEMILAGSSPLSSLDGDSYAGAWLSQLSSL